MKTLLPDLRDKILAASNVKVQSKSFQAYNSKFKAGEGSLTDVEIQDLREWTFTMDVADEHLLTRCDQDSGLQF